MTGDEDFLFGRPVEEVDEPLDDSPHVGSELELQKLKTQENDKDRKDKR